MNNPTATTGIADGLRRIIAERDAEIAKLRSDMASMEVTLLVRRKNKGMEKPADVMLGEVLALRMDKRENALEIAKLEGTVQRQAGKISSLRTRVKRLLREAQ